ncbi:uncharacterized protein YfbU (UPF0304 family) [Psychrobacter sp. PL15]|uniref:YfbU family protein n=1 Tax=Psychrobacter sp. PL15 TaxID=3071719 RepID=UPI002E0C1A3A|nr:uncharacterized protein YfbU (UPF0304 family) [Psychrobacter sp. PL15]
MSFTDTERVILANQYEILGKLSNEQAYLDLAENLKDGHAWIYDQQILVSPIFSKEQSDFVVSILELYDAIQDSFDALSDKGSLTPDRVKFPGFDGNNEGEYMRFFSALVKNQQFAHVKAHTNSHMQKISTYEGMLSKWESLGKGYMLSLEDIEAIFSR